MKVCIIGGSGHYRYALEGLSEKVRLSAFAAGSADEDIGKLSEALRTRSPLPRHYADWRLMLEREAPDIAVVNPHFAHTAGISLECIRRGIHVFSEKPVATEWADFHALRAALDTRAVFFSAMFGIRYTPAFLAAHAATDAGRIGEVRLLQAQKSYKLGQRPAFFGQRASYGGSIPWVGSHAIDWVHWFAARPFVSVSAQHSRIANGGNGDLEVSAQCQFVLEDEITAQVSIDYLRPANAPSHDDDRLRVVGSRGVVEVRSGRAYLINDEMPGEQTLDLPPAGSIFAEFVEAVLTNGRCMPGMEDSFTVTEACLLARQAADEGRPLNFPTRAKAL